MEKLLFKVFFHPGMGIHTYDLSFWEAEPEDHCEFEASLGYLESLRPTWTPYRDPTLAVWTYES